MDYLRRPHHIPKRKKRKAPNKKSKSIFVIRDEKIAEMAVDDLLSTFRMMLPEKAIKPIGDCENLVGKFKNYNIYCCFGSEPNRKIDYVLSKLLVDNDIFEPSPILSDECDKSSYFAGFPTIGIIYAASGNNFVNLSRNQLLHHWRFLFRSNTLYEMLIPRYTCFESAIEEYHQQQKASKIFFEKLSHRFYGRVTCFTKMLVGANVLFVAFLLKIKRKKIISPPKANFVILHK